MSLVGKNFDQSSRSHGAKNYDQNQDNQPRIRID